MYPGYKDKLYLSKLFLNILILAIGNETMEYGKLFQIVTACKKTKNKEFVWIWGCRSVRGSMSVSCKVIVCTIICNPAINQSVNLRLLLST